jgi:hypothetical protein
VHTGFQSKLVWNHGLARVEWKRVKKFAQERRDIAMPYGDQKAKRKEIKVFARF